MFFKWPAAKATFEQYPRKFCHPSHGLLLLSDTASSASCDDAASTSSRSPPPCDPLAQRQQGPIDTVRKNILFSIPDPYV
jgi:hypothetical protein